MEVNFLLVVICLYSYFQLGSQVLESMKGYLEELVVELQQVHLNMTDILEVFVPPRSGKSFFFPAGIYQWQIQTLGGRGGSFYALALLAFLPLQFFVFFSFLFCFFTKIRGELGPRSATVYFQVN